MFHPHCRTDGYALRSTLRKARRLEPLCWRSQLSFFLDNQVIRWATAESHSPFCKYSPSITSQWNPCSSPGRSPTSRFLAWCSSRTGIATLRYLRWLAPTSDVLQARLQSELGCRPPSATLRLWVTLAQGRGVPLRSGNSLYWGRNLSWSDALATLHVRCVCPIPPGPAPFLELRATCGKTRLAPPAQEALTCIWCNQPWSVGVCRL